MERHSATDGAVQIDYYDVPVHLLISRRSTHTAACEKSIACSTCHVILDSDVYDVLEEPSDDENDMLDMAFGLTDT